jgi:hypothetical protein
LYEREKEKTGNTKKKMNKQPRKRVKWYGYTFRQNEDRILKKALI